MNNNIKQIENSPKQKIRKKISYFWNNVEGFGIVAICFVAIFDGVISQPLFSEGYSKLVLAALLFIGIKFIRIDAKSQSTDSINNQVQFFETQIKKIVTNNLTLYHTPSGKQNYSAAIEKFLTVKKVQSTYFFKHSWESKPFLDNVKMEYDKYYKELDDRVSKGLLHSEWVVLVDTEEKIDHLLKRIDHLCEFEDCIMKGYSKIRVINQSPYVARMNFQINGDHSVIFSIAGDTEELDTGAVITHENFYQDMKKFYRKIWDDAIKIIDSGVHWDKLTELVSLLDKTKAPIIDKLKKKYPNL